ncbi:alpha-D-ribose 1-methylphosphonate 5-triphosphate synthase subunit PhnL [Rhizomicrobium palustre]|uniref:Alpha-D-ribose 1-methylphosphonate 5-triphosphate synthase subunit PhnL n=1 Tax=Rhizomicrobium palustre TaxID=189966 RepID=A0A846N3G7_9PROT|nr:phosphonate C-P lyase system protein PhnL [Rhizomicrobium palustre]NIK89801.1 alpha-D-ribose 1-methylphosphonate 5-triphosphate synthase subunit PhnL [Rhizomicrobium palustre]
MTILLEARNLKKTFTLHNQQGVVLDVLQDIDLDITAGKMVVLKGPSGTGKSTLLRILYGNYRPVSGTVRIRHQSEMVDIVGARASLVLDIRRKTLSFVSQFLRVIPRISTLAIVMDPMLSRGVPKDEASDRAAEMLKRLHLPERIWGLAPATFSGGEQQRVNIARSFVDPTPVMLLDEPTASLDAENRDIVIELIANARERGAAMAGIFHDEAVSDRVATRTIRLSNHA